MNIGIDIDDTICSTTETLEVYTNKYIQENNITKEELWNIKENKEKFLRTYLKKIYANAPFKEGVRECFENLKKLGCKLYIITARTESYVNDIYDIINNYLQKHNLKVDAIFINGKDKVDICRENKIDIMIDDNIYNYYMLTKNNIKAVLFDDKNKYYIVDERVQSWYEITTYIKQKN